MKVYRSCNNNLFQQLRHANIRLDHLRLEGYQEEASRLDQGVLHAVENFAQRHLVFCAGCRITLLAIPELRMPRFPVIFSRFRNSIALAVRQRSDMTTVFATGAMIPNPTITKALDYLNCNRFVRDKSLDINGDPFFVCVKRKTLFGVGPNSYFLAGETRRFFITLHFQGPSAQMKTLFNAALVTIREAEAPIL